MALQPILVANYQVVRTNIPKKEIGLNEVDLVNQFQAPPGFRLHSWQTLKESQIIGSPHQIVMVFENMQQGLVEVPDEGGAGGIAPPADNDEGEVVAAGIQ